jgi:hypothetical protein
MHGVCMCVTPFKHTGTQDADTQLKRERARP